MSDRITSHDEAYACTTTSKNVGPNARSVFIISKAEDGGDNLIRYGDKVRFCSNSYVFEKNLFLHS